METSLNRKAEVVNSARGEFVGEHHRWCAERIAMYSPTYSLIYNPEGVQIGGFAHNFAILESQPGREPYIVRYLTHEQIKDPQALIDWLAAGDTRRNRPKDILARIEAEDAVREFDKLKARQAKADDGNEFVATVVRGGINKLHTFRHNGKKYEV